MGHTALDVHAAFQRLAAQPLWPGYVASDVPVAIYDGQDTWLFGHPAPPEGFEPTPHGDHARRYAAQHGQVRANSSETIGGVRVATFLLSTRDRRTADELAAVIVHEAFHVFQDEMHPGWSADEGALLTYPMDDATALGWRRYETEALRRALVAPNDSGAAAWAGAAVELRTARYGALDEDSRRYERGLELREGLARYVQNHALGRLPDTALPEEGFAADGVRARGYETGQAIAVLLDRLHPDWRDELTEGVWLDQLLGRATAASGVRAAVLPLDVRQPLLRQAEQDVEALARKRQERLDDFLEQGGWTLKVLVRPDEEPLWPLGFDPMNLTLVGEGAVLHRRWFKMGNARGRIEVLNRRGLTRPAGAHPVFNGIREVVITGLPREPEVFGDGGELWVGADGVSVHFEKATANVTGKQCVVLVGEGR